MQATVPAQLNNTSIRVLPVREDCVLVELSDLAEALALFEALRDHPIAGVREIIPAARTLLIEFEPLDIPAEALGSVVASYLGGDSKSSSGSLVEIPVRYDGEDLAEVAAMLGVTAEEVVRLHGAAEYVVAFTGFAPGFAYLAGGDPRLGVPRRKSPRTHVPAGAVGLAGEFTGVYPKTSPGGWQLIGTTPLSMFDIDREPAALLQPGSRVRFIDIGNAKPYEIKAPKAPVKAKQLPATVEGAAGIEILSVGLPVLFQDLGRSGQANQGISRSGAADRGALKMANRLVGNPPGAPALEITLGGLAFRMRGRGVLAVSGAPAPVSIVSASGARLTAPHNWPVALDDGDVVTLAAPPAGMRSYLAMRGGFAVVPVLGSAATDTLAQIGPAPLAAGDHIGLREVPAGALVAMDELPAFSMPRVGDDVVLDVVMGPRTDWFTESAVQSFLSQPWQVTAQSSRVGIRLAGEALERSITRELPSEATVHGAIQVPASGQPVLFLADHPLTGGYPVIANVAGYHLDLAGQVPVGARIRFNPTCRFVDRLISGKQT